MKLLSRSVKLVKCPTVGGLVKKVRLLFSSKYLLYTNTAISVGMSGVGDGIQQTIQLLKHELPHWDWRRSRDVGVWSAMIGPCCHYWYLALDWLLPGKTWRIVCQKVVLEQLVCSPIVIGSYLYYTSYMEGQRGTELHNEVLVKGKILYKAECVIWPPAQIINFRLLPTRFRVVYDNTISLAFDCYYSYVKYGKSNSVAHKDDNNQTRDHSTKATLDAYISNNLCSALFHNKSYHMHTHGIHAEAVLLPSAERWRPVVADFSTCSTNYRHDLGNEMQDDDDGCND